MACGAGLPVLAVATTAGHVVIMFIFPKLLRYLPRESRSITKLRISYQDGRGLLRTILVSCSTLRFAIDQVEVEKDSDQGSEEAREIADAEGLDLERSSRAVVVLRMQVTGKRPVSHLIAALSDIDGVVRVSSNADDTELE